MQEQLCRGRSGEGERAPRHLAHAVVPVWDGGRYLGRAVVVPVHLWSVEGDVRPPEADAEEEGRGIGRPVTHPRRGIVAVPPILVRIVRHADALSGLSRVEWSKIDITGGALEFGLGDTAAHGPVVVVESKGLWRPEVGVDASKDLDRGAGCPPSPVKQLTVGTHIVPVVAEGLREQRVRTRRWLQEAHLVLSGIGPPARLVWAQAGEYSDAGRRAGAQLGVRVREGDAARSQQVEVGSAGRHGCVEGEVVRDHKYHVWWLFWQIGRWRQWPRHRRRRCLQFRQRLWPPSGRGGRDEDQGRIRRWWWRWRGRRLRWRRRRLRWRRPW